MRIYNTLSGQKEEFVPLKPGTVKMYVCGPTVYSFIHIGNARPAVIFDSFRRYLEYRGFSVIYVQNFTDIDDKIIKAANAEGISPKTLADRYISEYFKDSCALGIKPATYHPRTTDFVDNIKEFIAALEKKKFAYQRGNDVYFDVSAFPSYGALSHRNPADMRAGSRVEVNENKDDPLDFVLWKGSKPEEPKWESPWGEGRPGWHIECSAMSTTLLGDAFDIHAGGNDLIFPHHEDERAQSEALTGKKWVSYWMHNGMISVKDEKMSKSVGNIFSAREALKVYGKNTIRMYLLSKHYRSPIEFSPERMEEARSAFSRISRVINEVDKKIGHDFKVVEDEFVKTQRSKMIEVLDDDFNTPQALSLIFDLVSEMISTEDTEKIKKIRFLLDEWNYFLGFDFEPDRKNADELVDLAIKLRNDARMRKDYKQSDEIRKKLEDYGIEVMDSPEGTKWRWK
ncbi:cysteine--tRNA ligase [Athalassotoga saccharophila]|uniref:cysteine--tRNA ligase n=1 Tax=Athalassotoga saccharophila TaxID=1441386 RepID=UPI00137A7381|nr:cysteine--tRNA ligase [Athalassotoga saccharophila]BBJ28960.1 cysteine--tRNA ligase [Athalassotoga saccharophila]